MLEQTLQVGKAGRGGRVQTMKCQLRYQLVWVIVSGLAVAAGSGCARAPWYSGEFVVLSNYDRTIVVKDWQEFGEAQPGRGFIGPGVEKSTFFPHLDRIPASTVVSWVIEEDDGGEVFSQKIDLQNIVPPNTDGYTEFLFGADGVWTVRFVQAVPHR